MRLSGQIYGVVSAPSAPPRGSGKSLIALALALRQADDLKYGICCNFSLNGKELVKYCQMMGYYNLLQQYQAGQIQVLPAAEGKKVDLEKFMGAGNRMVYLLDEASIFANSRNWSQMSAQFMANLSRARHDGNKLWWITQVYSQVDKQLRQQTDFIVQANSILRYDERLGTEGVVCKIHYIYPRNDYDYIDSKRESWGGLKTTLQEFSRARFRLWGPLTEADKCLFRVYNSFENFDDTPRLSYPSRVGTRKPVINVTPGEEYIKDKQNPEQIKSILRRIYNRWIPVAIESTTKSQERHQYKALPTLTQQELEELII
mgnify:CR=1 FL=1